MAMRLPEINSRGMLILQTLRRRPMTIHQAIEAHGEFVTPRAPRGIEHSKIVELYCDLVERGCIVREGIVYRITLAAKYRLEALERPAAPAQLVPPRVRDIWTKQLAGYGRMLIAHRFR
ncbi:hypothetical protein AAKU55_005785 [Oxalobacteraceae bacterium GrIS 1.11]